MALMVSVSGIRGIFGTDLTPENLARFTASYGTWVNGGTVVLGRDSRTTGKLCEDIDKVLRKIQAQNYAGSNHRPTISGIRHPE